MAKIFVAGSLNADLVVPVPRLPLAGETLTGRDLRIHPGGKGANQAVAAARLGAQTVMAGQAGNDAFGGLLIDSLRRAGVDVSRVGRVEGSSGVALISVLPGGENAIVISPGANATLTPDLVRERLAGLTAGDFLLCQLESPLDAVQAALETAKNAGAATVLDPAPAQPLSPGILQAVDWLTPNQSEAAALLGREGREIRTADKAREAARELRKLGPRAVIVKLGRMGCFVSAEDTAELAPGFEVEAVDATAAGDTFNAALAVALAEERGPLLAARFANAAAAVSVTRPGAQTSAPSRAEVERFVARQRK